MSSNYPPGVTGNEPQITGIWPIDQVLDSCIEDLKSAAECVESAIGFLDEQGGSSKENDELADKILKDIQTFQDNINSMFPED